MSTKTDTTQELYDIWKKSGFVAAGKLHQLVKSKNLSYSKTDIENFLKKQSVAQQHKSIKKVSRNPIVAPYPDYELQIDLLDLTKFGKKNKGNNWILIAIDIFSRKLEAAPIKTKSPNDVLPALKDVIRKFGKPVRITSDDGTEYKGVVKKYLEDENILHRIAEVGDHNVLGVVDRITRTMKDKIYKTIHAIGSVTWLNELQNLVDGYNETPHQNLDNETPDYVFKHESDGRDIQAHRVELRKRGSELTVGDQVRTMVRKSTFEKGYTKKWNDDVHMITGIEGNYYVLDDGSKYRAPFLQRVEIDAINGNNIVITPDPVQEATKERRKEIQYQRESTDIKNIIHQQREKKKQDYRKLAGKK